MKLRFPRLRRRGGTTPPRRPGPDEILARLSPGSIHCTRCGKSRTGGSVDPQALAWFSDHESTMETT